MSCWLEMFAKHIAPDWLDVLEPEFEKEYFLNLSNYLECESRITPRPELLFKAFELTPLAEVRACIIGQDPYPYPDAACGLAFATNPKTETQSSEKAIIQALEADLQLHVPHRKSVSDWANRGVLLLNAVLSTRIGKRGAHTNQGWETFTRAAIDAIKLKDDPVVFLLWGNAAIDAAGEINKPHHAITARHPSPQAKNNPKCKEPTLEESRPFSRTNNYLASMGLKCIDWSL